jgi:hypothetical protein
VEVLVSTSSRRWWLSMGRLTGVSRVEFDEKQVVHAAKIASEVEVRWAGTLHDLTIESEDQFVKAAGVLTELRRRRKAIEDFRKELTEPLDVTKRKIMSMFRGAMDELDNVDEFLSAGMVRYARVTLEEYRDEINGLKAYEADLREAGFTESADKERTLLVQKLESTPWDSLVKQHLRTQWKHEVVDFDILPDEYKVANDAELARIARESHDTKPVPGVKFYESFIAVSKRR